MQAILKGHSRCDAQTIKEALVRSLAEFRGAVPAKEDVTFMGVRIGPGEIRAS